jgi:Tfp pilus assembly protein PilF
MATCFNCGSNEHQYYGCPKRAIDSVNLSIRQLDRSNHAANSRLCSHLEEIALNTAQTTNAIRELTDILSFEFAELRQQFDILIGIELRPVATAARDHLQIGLKCLKGARLKNEMITRAITKINEALAADPSCYEAYIALGFAYLENNNIPQALDKFEFGYANSGTINQQVEALTLIARCTASLGNKFLAKSHYLEALRLDSKSAEANYYYGALLISDNNFPQAQQYLREAIQIYSLLYPKAKDDLELKMAGKDLEDFLTLLHSEKRKILQDLINRYRISVSELEKKGARKLIPNQIREAYIFADANADNEKDLYLDTLRKIMEVNRNNGSR